jgi:RNA 3'-terminal phosphate cyclase (ATP)
MAMTLEAAYEPVTQVVSGFCNLGLAPERIGTTAGKRMAGYEALGAFTWPYLQGSVAVADGSGRGRCLHKRDS